MKANKILGILLSLLALASVGFYLMQTVQQARFLSANEAPIADDRIQITDQKDALYQSSVLINSLEKQSEFGTGYVVGTNTVVTNKHVVLEVQDHPEKAVVRIGHKDKNGQVNFIDFKIKDIILPQDETMDVAVLHVEPQENGTTLSDFRSVAEFGDIHRVQVGTTLTVVGFPGDKEYATLWASTGEVDMLMDELISFRAVTAPGNSGSPMFDDMGKVVAMNNAGGDNASFGFLLSDDILSFIRENTL